MNNQWFCTLWFRGTGWRRKRFRGTGWHQKRSKKRPIGKCSHYWQKYATDTTNINYPHKLLANREIPEIIQGIIPPVHQVTADGVLTCGGALHAVHMVLSKEIVMGAVPSTARVFKDLPVVNWDFESRPIPIDMNTVVLSPRSTTKVLTGTGTSAPPICIKSQEIVSPRGSTRTQEFKLLPSIQNFHSSIFSWTWAPSPIFCK